MDDDDDDDDEKQQTQEYEWKNIPYPVLRLFHEGAIPVVVYIYSPERRLNDFW